MLPASLTTAISDLAAKIQALAGQPTSSLVKSTATATMGVSGNVPYVSLSALAHEDDYVRVAGTFTVNETLQEAGSGAPVARARVFTFDTIVAVGLDQRTCNLPAIIPRQSTPLASDGSGSVTIPFVADKVSEGGTNYTTSRPRESARTGTANVNSVDNVPAYGGTSFNANGTLSGGAPTFSPAAAPTYAMTAFTLTKVMRYHLDA